MKGWQPEFPYNLSDIVTNLERVSSWTIRPRWKDFFPWQPLPINTWKWNVDGSARGKTGPPGKGGVLRDSNGNILAKFAAFVGIRDSNEAEFLAMVFPLEIFIDREWMYTGSII